MFAIGDKVVIAGLESVHPKSVEPIGSTRDQVIGSADIPIARSIYWAPDRFERSGPGIVTAVFPAGSYVPAIGRRVQHNIYAVLWPARRSISTLYNDEQIVAVAQ